MDAANANMINALVLVVMGMWGVNTVGVENSPTPLIPVIVGIILFVCTGFVRNHHKVVSHIAVLLTLLIVVALAMPFMKALERENTMAMVRMGTMMLTSIIAMVYFIKSFRAARLSKQNRIIKKS
jgi:glucose dehydrogenase